MNHSSIHREVPRQLAVLLLKEEIVEDSRNKLRQALRGVAAAYDPESFLDQTPLAQMAAGRNGLMPSLTGSSDPSTESEPEKEDEASASHSSRSLS